MSEESKKNMKMAGMVAAVVASIAAGIGYVQGAAFREGFCEGYVAPSPSPTITTIPLVVESVKVESKK